MDVDGDDSDDIDDDVGLVYRVDTVSR